MDVKRAYFYAPATRPLFVHIPKEDREEGDEGMVARLNLSLYGTRDAAMNWTAVYTEFLISIGYAKGKSCPCNFNHPSRGLATTVHGDDFTSTGSTRSLLWLKAQFEERFEVTAKLLGPELGQEHEVRVLNRVLRWEPSGLVYEPDQRHAEVIIRELGLENAGSVLTPGTRAEHDVASAPNGVLGIPLEEESEPMNPQDATRFRGLAARCNYLAQDRVDLQYACKEVSRRMAKPRCQDWQLLKRIGRYLVGAPRFEQIFKWDGRPAHVDVYTDSDWAGCKTTCRSTSGGAMLWGKHCLKTWSSTQATVALSSAEAELYALTKGASQGLGMMTLLSDFGLTVSVTVHTDASAAIGIVRRAGIGKLRHLNVRYLWVQDQVKSERLWLEKVAGADNPADIATKHLSADIMRKHLESLGVRVGGGRARSAPILGSLGRRGRRRHTSAMGPQRPGGWSTVGTERRAVGGLQGVASSGKAEARVKKNVKWANAQAGATTAAAAKTKPTSAAAAAARVEGLLLGLCSCGGCGVYSGGSDEDGGNIGGRGNSKNQCSIRTCCKRNA